MELGLPNYSVMLFVGACFPFSCVRYLLRFTDYHVYSVVVVLSVPKSLDDNTTARRTVTVKGIDNQVMIWPKPYQNQT